MRPTSDLLIRGSLFDRLRDDGASSSADSAADDGRRPYFSLNDVREQLRRDVEALLNSRRRFLRMDPGYNEIEDTFINFGVPDFSNEGFTTKDHREELRREIERTLARHEPRLSGITVEPMDSGDRQVDILKFRIVATVRVESGPEALIFDTQVEPSDWSVVVEDAG